MGDNNYQYLNFAVFLVFSIDYETVQN